MKVEDTTEQNIVEKLDFYILENRNLRERIKELEDENKALKKEKSSDK